MKVIRPLQVFKDYVVPPEVEKMTNNGHSVTFTIEPAPDMDYPKVGRGLQGRVLPPS